VLRVDAVAQQAAQLNAQAMDGFVTTTFTTAMGSGDVVGWYERTLPHRGWAYRGREPHGDVYDGHPVPPAYLFTRGTQEVFSLTVDPTAHDYVVSYVALLDHCDTLPPYPLGGGDCSSGRPL
jgi:hypothetical protein